MLSYYPKPDMYAKNAFVRVILTNWLQWRPDQTLCSAESVLGMHRLNTSHKEDAITGVRKNNIFLKQSACSWYSKVPSQ